MNPETWPWYESVDDESIDQGDIIPECLVLHCVEDENGKQPFAELRAIRALVLTQTCDLANSKVENVTVCAVWSLGQAVLTDPALLKEATDTATRFNLALPNTDDANVDVLVAEIIGKSKALKKEFNSIIKGERPPFAMLSENVGPSSAPGYLVNFQQVYVLPLPLLVRMAAKTKPR